MICSRAWCGVAGARLLLSISKGEAGAASRCHMEPMDREEAVVIVGEDSRISINSSVDSSNSVRSTNNSNHNHNRIKRSRDSIFVDKSFLNRARMEVEVEIRWGVGAVPVVGEVVAEGECVEADDSD